MTPKSRALTAGQAVGKIVQVLEFHGPAKLQPKSAGSYKGGGKFVRFNGHPAYSLEVHAQPDGWLKFLLKNKADKSQSEIRALLDCGLEKIISKGKTGKFAIHGLDSEESGLRAQMQRHEKTFSNLSRKASAQP